MERRTGRTSNIILKALEIMTNSPATTVVIICHNWQNVDHISRTVMNVSTALGLEIVYNMSNKRLDFFRGDERVGRIIFRAVSNIESNRFRGIKPLKLFVDHAVFEVSPLTERQDEELRILDTMTK